MAPESFTVTKDAAYRSCTGQPPVPAPARHNPNVQAYLADVLPAFAQRAQNPPATNEAPDALLPDRWKANHPEAVLKFREQEQQQEQQQVADRKQDRRERRRRAKQLANRQEANRPQANSS